jgi:acetyltransferase-like isoleucine patch superfamily enzyme
VVGERTFLGSHAAVTPGKTIGAGSKVGAGAVVYRNVPDRHLAMGNPAKAHPIYG